MEAAPVEETEEAYYLEQVTLDDEEEDDFEYTEVEVEDGVDEDDIEEDEDLERAMQTLNSSEMRAAAEPKKDADVVPRPAVTKRPEILDDYIRNVLLKMGGHAHRLSPKPASCIPSCQPSPHASHASPPLPTSPS